jgi:hypothetical protein
VSGGGGAGPLNLTRHAETQKDRVSIDLDALLRGAGAFGEESLIDEQTVRLHPITSLARLLAASNRCKLPPPGRCLSGSHLLDSPALKGWLDRRIEFNPGVDNWSPLP